MLQQFEHSSRLRTKHEKKQFNGKMSKGQMILVLIQNKC